MSCNSCGCGNTNSNFQSFSSTYSSFNPQGFDTFDRCACIVGLSEPARRVIIPPGIKPNIGRLKLIANQLSFNNWRYY